MSQAQEPRGGQEGSKGVSGLLLAPLFPLPGVVLFPRAVLPLHIFEERYKAMTRDALEANRQIAMALLRPGWEKCYYSKPAIETVVCVGTILTYEQLPDGNYNFLLQGHTRARIVREVGNEAYRQALLHPLNEVRVAESELSAEREHLTEFFTEGPFAGTPLGIQFTRLVESPLPTADVADLVAFNLLEDVNIKQALLSELNVRRRVARTLDALDDVTPMTQSASIRAYRNPGVN